MRRPHVVAWIIALLNTVVLAGMILLRPRAEAANGDAIRLMTLNAQFFMSADSRLASNLDALSALLDTERPDIIALQETDANSPTGANQNGVWWLSRKHGYYSYYGPPTRSYTPGVALLSRWPISSARYQLLPARHSMARGAIDAVIEAPGGPLQVIVAHLQWAEQPGEPVVGNREDQVAQTDALVRMDRPNMPTVIMGDFNAGPGYPGPAYDMLSRGYDDAWIAANPMAGAGGYTWPASEPNQRIDLVWLSRNDWSITSGSARIHGTTELSDHRAVSVEVGRVR
jgi:endonuclease/exonuclease/phosphatase family metal-dependent hydrolase